MTPQKTNTVAFAWRMAIAMLLGYLLATIPQVILDPLLFSHVAFHDRHYPQAWLVAPIAISVLITTFLAACRERKHRTVIVMLPFTVACVLSIPIFTPELPHGNLTFVFVVWLVLGMSTMWLHDLSLNNPADRVPLPAESVQIEYIKEQLAIWKACTFGIVALYLGLLVTTLKELHAFNHDIVEDKAEIFLLDIYNNFQVMMLSLFVLVGPLYEASMKVIAANGFLLSVVNSPPKGAECSARIHVPCGMAASEKETAMADLKTPLGQPDAVFKTHEANHSQTDQEASGNKRDASALVQFYSVEYSAMMSAVSLWKNLQYGLWPIVLWAYYLLEQLTGIVPPNILVWLMAAVLPVGYIAFQSAMLDALSSVLYIEKNLRPLAAEIAGTQSFWLHERSYRRSRPSNLAYGRYWPPAIALTSPVVAFVYRCFHSIGWIDGLGFLTILCIAGYVYYLTVKGKHLDVQIDAAVGL